MDVDDESLGVWIKQQKKRKNMSVSSIKMKNFECEKCKFVCKGRKELAQHMKSHTQARSYTCDKCENEYQSQVNLTEHIRQIHTLEIKCSKCEDIFENESKLKEHVLIHRDYASYKCEKCDIIFEEKREFNKHKMTHSAEKEVSEVSCNLCDKIYCNMSKLRRHDWRSHRQVDCNICGETLQSRQLISEHRQEKHNIFRKLKCKFYPNCIDGSECFFIHEEDTETENAQSVADLIADLNMK